MIARFIFAFVLVCLSPSPIKAQKIKLITDILPRRDVLSLHKLLDSIATKDNSIHIEKTTQLPIVKNYQSLLYHFDEERVEKKKLVPPFYKYRIELVCKGNIIISCMLMNTSYSPAKTIYADQNKTEIHIFDDIYKRAFGDTSHYYLLFREPIVFSTGCGFAPVPPAFYYTCMKLVDQKQYKVLDQWLYSHLLSYNVWAVYGFEQLKKKGYQLNDKQKRAIARLKKLDTEIEVCSGCETYDRKVSALVAECGF